MRTQYLLTNSVGVSHAYTPMQQLFTGNIKLDTHRWRQLPRVFWNKCHLFVMLSLGIIIGILLPKANIGNEVVCGAGNFTPTNVAQSAAVMWGMVSEIGRASINQASANQPFKTLSSIISTAPSPTPTANPANSSTSPSPTVNPSASPAVSSSNSPSPSPIVSSLPTPLATVSPSPTSSILTNLDSPSPSPAASVLVFSPASPSPSPITIAAAESEQSLSSDAESPDPSPSYEAVTLATTPSPLAASSLTPSPATIVITTEKPLPSAKDSPLDDNQGKGNDYKVDPSASPHPGNPQGKIPASQKQEVPAVVGGSPLPTDDSIDSNSSTSTNDTKKTGNDKDKVGKVKGASINSSQEVEMDSQWWSYFRYAIKILATLL